MHVAAFPSDAEARLVAALQASGNAPVSVVAEVDARVVGHVLFTPVSIQGASTPGPGGRPACRSACAGLAPLAVRPEFQRRGIGARLVEAGLHACRAAGFGSVVVLGDPRYYRRFGFRRALAHGLGNEYGVDEEFMVLELQPGALAGVFGVVKYGSEFAPVAAR